MNCKERIDKYNLLDKEVLVAMLIARDFNNENLTTIVNVDNSNSFVAKVCNFYMSGTDTSMNCMHCGYSKYEHQRYL